jgi:hypothetical protein
LGDLQVRYERQKLVLLTVPLQMVVQEVFFTVKLASHKPWLTLFTWIFIFPRLVFLVVDSRIVNWVIKISFLLILIVNDHLLLNVLELFLNLF